MRQEKHLTIVPANDIFRVMEGDFGVLSDKGGEKPQAKTLIVQLAQRVPWPSQLTFTAQRGNTQSGRPCPLPVCATAPSFHITATWGALSSSRCSGGRPYLLYGTNKALVDQWILTQPL